MLDTSVVEMKVTLTFVSLLVLHKELDNLSFSCLTLDLLQDRVCLTSKVQEALTTGDPEQVDYFLRNPSISGIYIIFFFLIL